MDFIMPTTKKKQLNFVFAPKVVALKLHGVDVDIKVIKRKGEPLNDPTPIQPPTPSTDLSPNNPNGCPCSHNSAMKPSASSSAAFDSQTTNSDHTSLLTADGESVLDENENTSESSSTANWQTTTTAQIYSHSEQRQPLSLNQCCSRSMKTTKRANTIDCSTTTTSDQHHHHQQPRQTNPFGSCSSGMFKRIECRHHTQTHSATSP